MIPDHIGFLRCPKTGERLVLADTTLIDGRVESGVLRSDRSGNEYPIINFIPRFVPMQNYTSNFGLEWNVHSRTQYDGTSGHDLSRQRFFDETGWPENLSGETILEVGSGSGRFTEHALKTGATICSFDFSNAVDANYRSNGTYRNLCLVQASVFEMPFVAGSFDRAYCFGVLQHTPAPRRAFDAIATMVKPGGQVVADIYEFYRWVLLNPLKYAVRAFTRKVEPQRLYSGVKRHVDRMWPLARQIRRVPGIGASLNWHLLLVADYSRELPDVDEESLKSWSYLDTFDMLSPMYDSPKSIRTFRRWFREGGYVEIDVRKGWNGVQGRGRRPSA
ncbi:MAG: class I SAM-dependent methyltransferase [Proteobacteria bacterium]|nr:class I SAM-dependent methyltransferase [Pseudomonadota bacterium]